MCGYPPFGYIARRVKEAEHQLADAAVSRLIFLIASILVASTVSAVIIKGIAVLTEGIEDNSSALDEELRTKITVINDPNNMNYNATAKTLPFYVKNTGTATIKDMLNCVVFINGTPFAAQNLSIVNIDNPASGLWCVQETVEITCKNCTLAVPGDYFAKVVVRTAASDTFMFRL